MARATGPSSHTSPPTARQRQLGFVLAGCIFVILFVFLAVDADRRAVLRHEKMFNEQQAAHVLLARCAFEANFDGILGSARTVARHVVGERLAGRWDPRRLTDFLRAELVAYPEHLAFAVYDSSGQLASAQGTEASAGGEAGRLASEWARSNWERMSNSSSDLLVPPLHVTAEHQLMGVVVPLRVDGELTAMLVTVQDLEPLVDRIVVPMRSGKYGAAYLLDGRGTVVYDHEAQIIGRNVFDGLHADYPDVLRLDRRMTGEPSGTDEYSFTVERNGQFSRKLIAWDTAQVGDEKLIVALSAPDFEINETVAFLRFYFVLVGALLALALVLMSILFFRARQAMLERSARELETRVRERTDALRASEQMLQLAFELAPVGFALVDLDERYTRVSRSLCDMLGYTRDELLSARCAEVTHPADRDSNHALFQGMRQGTQIESPLEKRYIAKDGRIVYCLFQAVLMRDPEERPLQFIVQVVDVTERKRAEEQLRERTAQLETLRRMALEVTTQLDVNLLLKSIVSHAIDLLQQVRGGLYLHDPERDVLEWVVADTPTGLAALGSILRRGEGLSGKVLETGKAMFVDDYEHWEGRSSQYDGCGFRAVAAVPVRYGDEFLGVLNVVADPPRTFCQADIELLTLFAAHAAIALHHARLLEAEQKQRALAEALAGAAAVLGGTLELEEVFDRILEQVQRVLGGNTCSISLIRDGVCKIVRWRGYEQFGADELLVQLAFQVSEVANLRRMVETGEPVVIQDTTAYAGWVPVDGQAWLRSYVGAPIRVGKQTVGFLNMDGARPGRFTYEDGQRLVAFAHYAAIAIENARLYEQARRDAETKAVLLEEINHRVKNNLSAILGLLYVELSHARWQRGGDCASVIQDLVSRIQGLATLHSVLSDTGWTPLRLGELSQRIIRTVLHALSPDRSLRLEVVPSTVLVTPAQAHSLALIIHELAANAIQHAWQGRTGGRLHVAIALEGETVMFEMRDDGQGYPIAALQSSADGVGLFLVKNLVEQGLHGELILRNDGGAVATVRFRSEVQERDAQ